MTRHEKGCRIRRGTPSEKLRKLDETVDNDARSLYWNLPKLYSLSMIASNMSALFILEEISLYRRLDATQTYVYSFSQNSQIVTRHRKVLPLPTHSPAA
jgi:hypothetical protein